MPDPSNRLQSGPSLIAAFVEETEFDRDWGKVLRAFAGIRHERFTLGIDDFMSEVDKNRLFESWKQYFPLMRRADAEKPTQTWNPPDDYTRRYS